MERSEYAKLDVAEEHMWWFAALHANLLSMYERAGGGSNMRPILDAGCGTGGFLARLRARAPHVFAIGIDASPAAIGRAAVKNGKRVCAGSINALPFADRAFGAIFSADVLCHGAVDEQRALAQFRRCLAHGGLLILNLPAYGWLMSSHDTAVHNVRRYTRGRLRRILRNAGFRVILTTYWNTILFPAMVLQRKLLSAGNEDASDVRLYSSITERICRAATASERALLQRGGRLPFGGSLIAVAVKGDAHPG